MAEVRSKSKTRPPAGDPNGPKSNGVVVPHPLKWHQRLAAALIYGLIRAVAATLRYQWEYHPSVVRDGHQSFIFCIWHNRLALALIMHRDYAHRRRQPPRLAAIVSASKDGGVVARVLEHFGVHPVRGSSSRRGPQALLELTTLAERDYDIAITPDGPRGPCYVVQPGVISLAQITGRPIVPASHTLDWKIRVKSWDRFQIPLPFSRVRMKFTEPLHIPRDATDAERESLRQQLENRLNALTED